MTPAILYTRVSPRPDETCESLDFQEDFGRRYFDFLGIEVGLVIRDPDTSARLVPLSKRVGGAQLLDLTTGRKPKYLTVGAYRLDRLWRDPVDGNLTLRAWRRAGVACHFAAEGGQSINTGTATGRFLVNVLLAKAAYEPDLTAERTSDAMQRHQDNGRSMSGKRPPYGWTVVAGQLIESPSEQEAIAKIITLGAAGRGVRLICSLLNAQGVPCRSGLWHPQQVARVLARAKRLARRTADRAAS